MPSQSQTFTVLIGFAFCMALTGLIGNFVYLFFVTLSPDKYEDPTRPDLSGLSIRRGRKDVGEHEEKLLTEEQVYARMLRDSVAGLDECHEESQTSSSFQNSEWMAQRKIKLGRFGFMNALTNHLSVPSATNNSQKCQSPPSTSCRSSMYTMVVTWESKNTVRHLFLNLIHWLTDPRVATMQLVMLAGSKTILQDDKRYGQRILSWHEDGRHKLHISFVDTIWALNFTSSMVIDTDAVLWMDGDSWRSSNQRGIQAGYELWKRNSKSVVACKGYTVTKATTRIEGVSASTEQQRRRRLEQNNPKLLLNSTAISDDLIPFCKDETFTDLTKSSTPQFSDMNGVFFHRNYLCFTSHSVFRNLKRFSLDFQESRWTLSLLLAQLSGQSLKLYPPIVETPPEPINNLKEEEEEEEESDNATENKPHERRIEHIQGDVPDPEFITAVTGFLGSIPVGAEAWCGSSVCQQKDNGIVLESYVSWLNDRDVCHRAR